MVRDVTTLKVFLFCVRKTLYTETMKQFDEWNGVKKNLGSEKERPLVKRGEIFWCLKS
jgi:hypothetical protein